MSLTPNELGSRTLGSRKPWLYVAGIAGGAVAAGLLRSLLPPVEYRLHRVNRRGVVEADPRGLAAAAGAPLATYALASMMQSEEHDDRGRLAVGRAAWNKVGGDAGKLFRLLAPRGHFGTQVENHYAATYAGPTARTLELARAVVAGRVPDFVEGATQWDAPATQDQRHALFLADPERYPGYRLSSADLAEKRRREGKREVWVPGVPKTRFWSAT